jgi:hypothetical protein
MVIENAQTPLYLSRLSYSKVAKNVLKEVVSIKTEIERETK